MLDINYISIKVEDTDSFKMTIFNRDYCIARATLINVVWQPEWERETSGQNGHTYMPNRSHLCPRLYNIVNWLTLTQNKKFKENWKKNTWAYRYMCVCE